MRSAGLKKRGLGAGIWDLGLCGLASLTLTPSSGFAHRLDEYLQAALISVGRDSVRAEITLTPGVAVFPIVAAEIDTNGDGIISEAEQRTYSARVLGDLSLTIDGHPLRPVLISMKFPGIDEMKEGLGAIRMEVEASLPRGGTRRRLIFENHHQSRMGAYLVNCLAPGGPDIRIVGQIRNYTQSHYELDYEQAGSNGYGWMGAVGVLLLGRFAYLWRRQAFYS